MTRNDNPSRLSGRWKSMTKECHDCRSKSKKYDKTICNFEGIISFISTKSNRMFNKCKLKLKDAKIK